MNKQKQAWALKNVMSWKTNKNCKGTILARLKETKNIKKNPCMTLESNIKKEIVIKTIGNNWEKCK